MNGKERGDEWPRLRGLSAEASGTDTWRDMVEEYGRRPEGSRVSVGDREVDTCRVLERGEICITAKKNGESGSGGRANRHRKAKSLRKKV